MSTKIENTSFFYSNVEINNENKEFICSISNWANTNKKQVYAINKTLVEQGSYTYENALLILCPKHKLTFIDFSGHDELFDDYVDEFIYDIYALAKKYAYLPQIGKTKDWLYSEKNRNSNYYMIKVYHSDCLSFDEFINDDKFKDDSNNRICELLTSLLIGSINDPSKVTKEIPETLLEKVKKKIILFDGTQTNFIYGDLGKKITRIQGLSGAGKTELLLHKLKELYVNDSESKIAFTCHNKILANNLNDRIPDFFDFMKVSAQISDTRLLCKHAWGSSSNYRSGFYRYICHYYSITFNPYSKNMLFNDACENAILEIKEGGARRKNGTCI